MKYTNRASLPDAIVRAVTNDGYSKGDADYSVTQLLKPARIVALEKKHAEELTEDVSDRIWSLLGQAAHTIAERANHQDIAERRLTIKVGEITVSGGMDLYQEKAGTYFDYKVTSVWKVKNGDFEEWTNQINLYSVILRENKIDIKNAYVIAILRDWSKLEARRDPEYPQSQVSMIPIPLWEPEKALSFMKTRIAVHEAAKKILPECTIEEMWAKPDVWAVKMTKAGKAVNGGLYAVEDKAKDHANRIGGFVEYRPGIRTRCEAYCAAAKFCSTFQAVKK